MKALLAVAVAAFVAACARVALDSSGLTRPATRSPPQARKAPSCGHRARLEAGRSAVVWPGRLGQRKPPAAHP